MRHLRASGRSLGGGGNHRPNGTETCHAPTIKSDHSVGPASRNILILISELAHKVHEIAIYMGNTG
jgi:hypothetical protein